MAAILTNRQATDTADRGRPSRRLALRLSCLLSVGLLVSGQALAETGQPGFDPVYDLLQTHCGDCHVQGGADGPWSLNTPPSASRYPECLERPEKVRLRCATYHELVDEPAPGIPAWIRPAEPRLSEPYAQACDPAVSFHIGHSLPAALSEPDCAMLLKWIEMGAHR